MEKLFTVFGATTLAALVLGLALAPVGIVPWEGLLCVHFVNVWLWIAAFIVVSRRHAEERKKEKSEAVGVLFLLELVTVALALSSIHSGILLAGEHGILLGQTVYRIVHESPFVLALPGMLLSLGALAILATMKSQSNLDTLIEESEEARVIRRLNAELTLEKQKLQSVVHGIRAGLAVLEPDGKIRWANEIYASWFGADRPVLGRDSRKILGLAPDDRIPWPHALLSRGRQLAVQSEHLLTLPTGDRRQFLVSAYALTGDDGSITGHVQLLQDISQQKEMQTRLMESEKLSTVGQLIGSVAHELNNPLAILMGYSEVGLEESDDPETLRTSIEVIRKNTVRCQKIVRNLLAFVRRHSDERTFSNLRDPFTAVIELKRHQLEVDNIKPVLDCPLDLPSTLMDEHKMQQVFLNLVNNAHDALVDLKRHGTIRLAARVEGKWIVATVEDDGPGIPPEILAKVMSPFFTTKGPGRGTGLGLPICKSIVEEAGGTMELASVAGKGTTFTVRLPILMTEAELELPVEAPKKSKGSILVIDDEPEMAALLERILGEAGHRCVGERSAKSALERLDKGERYDLVLCDLKMPGMDGMTFLDEVVKSHSDIARRITFLSGDTANPRTREKIAERGHEMLEKPYTRDEILKHVDKALADLGQPAAA